MLARTLSDQIVALKLAGSDRIQSNHVAYESLQFARNSFPSTPLLSVKANQDVLIQLFYCLKDGAHSLVSLPKMQQMTASLS